MTDPTFQNLIVKSLDDLRADVHWLRDRSDQRFDEVNVGLTELRKHVTELDVSSRTNRGWVRTIVVSVIAPIIVAGATALGALAYAGVFNR